MVWLLGRDITSCLWRQLDVFEAAELYQRDGTELIILAGKDYGSGNSRDWVAKGPHLLVTSHWGMRKIQLLLVSVLGS